MQILVQSTILLLVVHRYTHIEAQGEVYLPKIMGLFRNVSITSEESVRSAGVLLQMGSNTLSDTKS